MSGSRSSWPRCGARIEEDFGFCPSCGIQVQKSTVCPNCGTESVVGAKFCPNCSTQLPTSSGVVVEIDEISDPLSHGITPEFSFPTSQTFEFAVAEARGYPSFSQYGEGKKACEQQ